MNKDFIPLTSCLEGRDGCEVDLKENLFFSNDHDSTYEESTELQSPNPFEPSKYQDSYSRESPLESWARESKFNPEQFNYQSFSEVPTKAPAPSKSRSKNMKEKKSDLINEDRSFETRICNSLMEDFQKIVEPRIIKKAIEKAPKEPSDRNSGSQNYKGLVFRAFARFVKWVQLCPNLYNIFLFYVPDNIVAELLHYVETNLQGKKSKQTKNKKIADSSKISNMKEVQKFIHDQGTDNYQTLEIKRALRNLLTWFLTEKVYYAWLRNEENSQSCTSVKAFLLKNRSKICNILLNPKPPMRTNFDKVTSDDENKFLGDYHHDEVEEAPKVADKVEKTYSITNYYHIDTFLDYNSEFRDINTLDNDEVNLDEY